jgi:signal recognition particle receptor subunit beta
MAAINRHKRELIFKLVFYGPGLGGKTTTLKYVHAATKPDHRGNMVSLATDTDRTLYFDYLPVRLLKLGDMTVKLQLYTVPGQVYYAATRKLVLSGADGIVFVADTQAARLDSNHESLDDLNANLAEQGRKLSSVPHAFQWNKRDLPDLVPVDELDRRLNLFGAPSVPTVATTGEGVFTTLERVTRAVIEAYRADLPTATRVEGVPLYLDAEEIGLADAIKGLADAKPARPPSNPRRSPEAAPPTSSRKGEAQPNPSFGTSPPPHPVPAATTAFAQSSAIANAVVHAVPSQTFGHVSASGAAPLAAVPSTVDAPHANAPGVLSRATPAQSQNEGAPTFSLADLWPASDRDAVRRAEQALAAADTSGAVTAAEDLLTRVLAAGSVLLGGQAHPRDPVLLVTLLGLDGARYLGFRGVTRGLRSKRSPTLRDALECYAFALEARRALDRAGRP